MDPLTPFLLLDSVHTSNDSGSVGDGEERRLIYTSKENETPGIPGLLEPYS
jgi:hypothetical protein